MNIGYRAKEQHRVQRIMEKCDENGLQSFKATFEKHQSGRHKGLNKWEEVKWRIPQFPLFYDNIYKDEIGEYWRNKPVRFAERNNCIGCFFRNPALLKIQSELHPEKYEWFAQQERYRKKGTWKENITYDKIRQTNFSQMIPFGECNGECSV